MAKLIRN